MSISSNLRGRATSAVHQARAAVHPDQLSKVRVLAPFAHRINHPVHWSSDPRPLAVGVCCGLLWAFWFPVGQVLLACIFALLLRGNLVAAAAATFVTNPLTIAPIAYVAHNLGSIFITADAAAAFNAEAHAPLSSLSVVDALYVQAANLGLPWLLGMALLGPLTALLGLVFTPIAVSTIRRIRSRQLA